MTPMEFVEAIEKHLNLPFRRTAMPISSIERRTGLIYEIGDTEWTFILSHQPEGQTRGKVNLKRKGYHKYFNDVDWFASRTEEGAKHLANEFEELLFNPWVHIFLDDHDPNEYEDDFIYANHQLARAVDQHAFLLTFRQVIQETVDTEHWGWYFFKDAVENAGRLGMSLADLEKMRNAIRRNIKAARLLV